MSTPTKHTAGPWKIIRIEDDGGIVVIQLTDTTIQLCDGFEGPKVNMQDASLIAAAPELLAALEELARATTQELGPVWKQSSLGVRVMHAINKAKGGA